MSLLERVITRQTHPIQRDETWEQQGGCRHSLHQRISNDTWRLYSAVPTFVYIAIDVRLVDVEARDEVPSVTRRR